MSAAGVLTGTAIASTGLMAGLFFGWTVSVIPGTRLIEDRSYIEAMQSINRAIINPWFVLPFIGAPFMLAAAAVAHARVGNTRAGWLLASAAGTYVIGLLGVTARVNVPLNDALDDFSITAATDAALGERRRSYEQPWNRWHLLRTVAVVGSFTCASIAAVVESD